MRGMQIQTLTPMPPRHFGPCVEGGGLGWGGVGGVPDTPTYIWDNVVRPSLTF